MSIEMTPPRAPWLHAFLQNARERPAAEAVVTPDARVTFGGLASLAGAVQQQLLRHGPGPDAVAIVTNDPIQRAAAIIGTAAAGRAHVLLDPSRSAEALREAAGRLGAGVALGVTEGGGFTAEYDVAGLAPAELDPVPRPADAPFAFVATSGSTGDPKYVMLTDQAAGAHLPGEPPSIRAQDRVFRAFNYSGNSINALIDSLRFGATHLAADPLRLSASGLHAFLAREQATIVRMSPSLSRLVMRPRTGAAVLNSVRSIGGGGEPMLWSDVAALRAMVGPDATITHGYASTETRSVTSKVIARCDPVGEGAVPAGLPRRSRRLWIDAGDGRPAGPGIVGRIVVEAEGTFGTVGPDFDVLPDGWLRFRSSDLGEVTDTGELLHRGRQDRVVKVGAVRIDPAVVEDILRRVPGVLDVCAVPVPSGVGDSRLVAHVVTDPSRDSAVTVDELRDFALARLMSPAVPARFLLRHEPLPTLPSGKTDVRALLRGEP